MAPTIDKSIDNRMRWFGYVMRRGDLEVMRLAIEINVKGIRGKSLSKKIIRYG